MQSVFLRTLLLSFKPRWVGYELVYYGDDLANIEQDTAIFKNLKICERCMGMLLISMCSFWLHGFHVVLNHNKRTCTQPLSVWNYSIDTDLQTFSLTNSLIIQTFLVNLKMSTTTTTTTSLFSIINSIYMVLLIEIQQ